MPLVSVITPTQAHNADHILAVWESLTAQDLPSGWELEWLVQEDGVSPSVADRLPSDERVRYDALGVQIGSPATRNHALGRARGDVVAGMDHDDWYEPGGLAALLAPLVPSLAAPLASPLVSPLVSPLAAPLVSSLASPLAEGADVTWSCGRCVWVMEDGATWMAEDVFAPGRVSRRAVTDHFTSTNDFPFPAAMTAFRRVALVAHGGWPAVARSTDAVLLASFSDDHDGWWVDSTVAAYRRWPAQKTVQPQDWAIRDLPHVRGLIAQRREARDALLARDGIASRPL